MIQSKHTILAEYHRSTSVNDLGRRLECCGAKNGNMCGRDLKVIRKVLGFERYAELSKNGVYTIIFNYLLFKGEYDAIAWIELDCLHDGITNFEDYMSVDEIHEAHRNWRKYK